MLQVYTETREFYTGPTDSLILKWNLIYTGDRWYDLSPLKICLSVKERDRIFCVFFLLYVKIVKVVSR